MFIPRPSKYIKHPNQVVTSRAKFILFIFGWTQFWKNTSSSKKEFLLITLLPEKIKSFYTSPPHILEFLWLWWRPWPCIENNNSRSIM